MTMTTDETTSTPIFDELTRQREEPEEEVPEMSYAVLDPVSREVARRTTIVLMVTGYLLGAVLLGWAAHLAFSGRPLTGTHFFALVPTILGGISLMAGDACRKSLKRR